MFVFLNFKLGVNRAEFRAHPEREIEENTPSLRAPVPLRFKGFGFKLRRCFAWRHFSALSSSIACLKYAMESFNPASRSIFGSHPSNWRALLMSGRRCLGSSCGKGS